MLDHSGHSWACGAAWVRATAGCCAEGGTPSRLICEAGLRFTAEGEVTTRGRLVSSRRIFEHLDGVGIACR
jgi:hypothetical protein